MSRERLSGQPRTSLQQWIEGNPVRDEMLWKGAFGQQVMFIRDNIVPVFGTGLNYDQMRDAVSVISTHRSKSIELPVYQLERPDRDLRVVLRNNFYNWKMSVLSGTPIQANFDGLFHTTPPIEPDYTGDELHPVYFEGFPRDLIFSYFAESDRRRWSAEIQSDEALWTSVFLMMRSLGDVKPLVWHTKESHRKELGLDK